MLHSVPENQPKDTREFHPIPKDTGREQFNMRFPVALMDNIKQYVNNPWTHPNSVAEFIYDACIFSLQHWENRYITEEIKLLIALSKAERVRRTSETRTKVYQAAKDFISNRNYELAVELMNALDDGEEKEDIVRSLERAGYAIGGIGEV